MKKIILLFWLTAMSGVAMAQKNKGIVKGTVYDSINDFALQSATVALYKQSDSTIVGIELTNTAGEFEIKEIPEHTPLYYIVSYTGYRPAIKNFRIDSATTVLDLKYIILRQLDKGELEEVVIQTVQPLRMNKDTLEINPNAFKLDSNAVVEDMLLRVPGLTVWGDGSITMNGRRIEKVMVDGKPFFGGAPQTATQNLPKNAIEKIQLYQEKDYTKVQRTDEKADSLYTMNIKLKEDKKKGIFGKVGAGYGTDDRYTGDGVIQGYNRKTQAGIAIGINNINKEEGTGENAFQDNTFKSNFRIYYGGRADNGGITRRTYGNLKIQHSFSEADNTQFFNRITGDYAYLNLNKNYLSNSTSIRNIDNYKQTSLTDNKNISNTTTNTAKFQYENRKKYGNFLSINAQYTNSFSTNSGSSNTAVFQNDTTPLSRTSSSSGSKNVSNNFNTFGFIRSNDVMMKEDPRKNFSISFWGGYNNSTNDSRTVNKFESFVPGIKSNSIDRKYNNDNSGYNGSATFSYDGLRPLLFGIYNFFNIDLSLKNSIRYNENVTHSRVSDLDSITGTYHNNTDLTNYNKRTVFGYNPALGISKSFNKSGWEKYYYWFSINLDLGYDLSNEKNESSISNRNLYRTNHYLAPRLNINYNYQKTNTFRIYSYMGANAGKNLPGIDQLYPIIDNTNRYDSTIGNPALRPNSNAFTYFNFDINRDKMNAKSSYGASLGFNLNNTRNAVSDSTLYDPSGKAIRYLINVNNMHNYNGNLNLNFSNKLNKASSISFRYQASFSNASRPGYINNISSNSLNNTLSNTLSTTYNLIDKFNITAGQTYAINRNEQQSVRPMTSTIKTYTTTGNINYFPTKNLTLNTSLNYQNNIAANGNAVSANIWNASAVYRFLKQQGELKLSTFDLLRQNKNITNFVQENSATTTITNGLQQYFILTFSYYPRKFGGAKKGGPPSRPSGIMIIK